ncbi:uncharacterized protein LOC144994948 isoform X2 [Oryzias latipes]
MKMAGLLWMSVSVLLFGSCTGITENQLAPMVDAIWINYKINTMFSLAASIPKSQNQKDQYDVSQVLNAENAEAVKTAMKNKEVYAQGRIVAAKVIKNPDVKGEYIHAEYRVLQKFDNLLNQQFDLDNDLMLFYVRTAPCVQKCTNEDNPENILKYLPKLKRWKHYAFAFSGLYLSRNPQKSLSNEQRRAGIKKVGDSLGLQNVFRCVESNGQMQCRTCADQNDQVADFCISDPTSAQSNDKNAVTPAPAVPNALIQRAPSNTGDGNTMTDAAQNQGGEATKGNQDNTDQEASSSQTRPENHVTEGGQARIEGGGRIGGRRGKGRVGRRRGRQRIGGKRGKGKVGRRGGRQRIGGRKGRQGIGGRRGTGRIGGKAVWWGLKKLAGFLKGQKAEKQF